MTTPSKAPGTSHTRTWDQLYDHDLVAELRALAKEWEPSTWSETYQALTRSADAIELLLKRESNLLRRVQLFDPLAR